MPTIQLSNNREARIFVTHRRDEDQVIYEAKKQNKKRAEAEIRLPKKIAKQKKKIEKRGHTVIRQTMITLEIGDERFRAASFCSSLDNFSKLEGRRNAINRVLDQTRAVIDKNTQEVVKPEVLSKEDRQTIFYKVCPEFIPKPEEQEAEAVAST